MDDRQNKMTRKGNCQKNDRTDDELGSKKEEDRTWSMTPHHVFFYYVFSH